MSKKVFIYSIPRSTATGIGNFKNESSDKSLNKIKIGRATDSIMALYSPKVGGLANYISYTPHINPETGTPYVDEKGHTIMLQQYLEKKWNKPEGFFTNAPWRKGDSLKEDDLTYFQTKSWQVNDGCAIFDLADMDQEMGYYVCLASHLVANSEKEWREHKWPKAQYYIALENESEQIKNKKNNLKVKAFSALSSSDLTDVVKRKIVSLLDLFTTKEQLTVEQIDNSLFDYIDRSSFTPGSNLDKFMAIINLRSTPHGREQFEARYILAQAIDSRVVIEKQDTYTWLRPKGNIIIGDRYADAVDYILNPKKASEVEELQSEIKAKLAQ